MKHLPSSETDQREHERHKDPEIEEPKSEQRHFEFAIGLRPAGMKFDHAAGVEMIADDPNEKRGRNQRAERERESMSANLRVARDEKARQHNAERHERVDMEKRHRRVERELNPKGERPGTMSISAASKIFFAPVPEQQQSGGNGIKKSALRHEHRQRNAFPRDVVDVLIIDKFEIAQKLKAGETAVEKKTSDRESAAPAIEGVTGRD